MKIVQLVPHPLNHISGISDYALKLAHELLKEYKIQTGFVVYEKRFLTVPTEPNIQGFPVTKLSARTPNALLSCLPNEIEGMIFHYNFRGQNRPSETAFWMLKALRLARQKHRFKFVVMFHELMLTLKFKGITLLNPFHVLAARGIAKMADTVITNNIQFQATLSNWKPSRALCLPNFSNLGEPKHISPLRERHRRMIVLGTLYSRPKIYRHFFKELLIACQILGLEEIYDIGPTFELDLSDLGEIRLIQMGVQPAPIISQLMASSWAGFFDYSSYPGCLGKSTIFAAYCAHALIPISSQYNPSEADGLEINKHYLVPDHSLRTKDLTHLQSIANNAYQWYDNHTLAKSTQVFASHLLADLS